MRGTLQIRLRLVFSVAFFYAGASLWNFGESDGRLSRHPSHFTAATLQRVIRSEFEQRRLARSVPHSRLTPRPGVAEFFTLDRKGYRSDIQNVEGRCLFSDVNALLDDSPCF